MSTLREKIEAFSKNKKVLSLIFVSCLLCLFFFSTIGFFSKTKIIDIGKLKEDITIKDSGHYILTGYSDQHTVSVISGNAVITMKNLNIDVSAHENLCAFKVGNSTAVKIILEGENTLKSGDFCAGLQTQETSFLEIARESTGKLYAQGGKFGAGIGSGASTESLNTYVPGIGTGQYFGIISLLGGHIKAVGGKNNYSIGGDCSENDKIIINGATVSADTICHFPTAQ